MIPEHLLLASDPMVRVQARCEICGATGDVWNVGVEGPKPEHRHHRYTVCIDCGWEDPPTLRDRLDGALWAAYDRIRIWMAR